jgi:hypothetical protein
MTAITRNLEATSQKSKFWFSRQSWWNTKHEPLTENENVPKSLASAKVIDPNVDNIKECDLTVIINTHGGNIQFPCLTTRGQCAFLTC